MQTKMADLVFWFTSLFFFSIITFNTISWLSLWERQEFRIVRILTYLMGVKRGKEVMLGFDNWLRWIAIVLYGATIFWNGDLYYHLAVALIYFYLFIKLLSKIYSREYTLPTLSINSVIVVSLTLASSGILYLFPPLDRFLWLLIIDRINPLLLIFFVSIFLVFFDFRKDAIINKAIDKLDKHKNLLTIAVVGSYAKGSTKEFITRILSANFNVLENTVAATSSLGIAKTIISKISSKIQLFIVEMEDHGSGEISEMVNIANPKIAVITGGSNFEIVQSLPRDGIILLNGNSISEEAMNEKIRHKKFVYSLRNTQKANIFASNIKVTKFSISFDVNVFNKKHRLLNVKLLGMQNVENLLPGIFLGLYLGINFPTIRSEIARLRPLTGTMDPLKSQNGTVLIDDTYNSNVNSIRNAVEYMKLYRGMKILVLEPFSEINSNSSEDFIELGKLIGKSCDYLFLTNEGGYAPLLTGIRRQGSLCMVQILSPVKIANFIKKNTQRADIVVFEGREARSSLSLISAEPIFHS